jgi:hypothetical protein
MLISNETPVLTWTLSGVSGSVWANSTAPFSRLTNGAPRVGCRLIRASGSTGFELRAQWSTLSRPSVFALLGLGEEWAGLSFDISAANISGGGSDIPLGTQSVQRLPDGSLAVIALISVASNVDSLTLSCGTFTAAAYTIGEFVVATAQEWRIRRDWTETVTKLSRENVTVTGQPFNVRRVQQRKASVTITPQTWARAVSLSQIQTLQKLQVRLSKNQPVLVIPALRAPGLGQGAAVDTDTVYASALFGWCSNLGQISLVSGSNLAELSLQFTEAPAGRVN